jgi:alanine racemase
MSPSRRSFITSAAAAGLTPSIGVRAPDPSGSIRDRFDPWIEVSRTALQTNVKSIAAMASGTGILAVIKNNAYGLGAVEVARILEPMSEIEGFAVVKPEAAIGLREAGIQKPVLVMGLFDVEEGTELVNQNIQLSASTDDAADRIRGVFRASGKPVPVHFYLDSGMGRMGIPTHRALPWITGIAGQTGVQVAGTYMAFAEDTEFDRIQLGRFLSLRDKAVSDGVNLGRLHAASSNAVFHFPPAHLDLVRPGIAIFGAYPSRPEEEREIAKLHCAVRLKARVVRVERLRSGDGVSYGRNYVAEEPTWTATLPIGHVDGLPRGAVNGMKILINERLYPVIGAVSASHCIVEVGEEQTVSIGDVATIIGPDLPELEPNNVASAAGASVYDVLMHLNPDLPRMVV